MPDTSKPEDLDEAVTEAIGGVQGGDEEAPAQASQTTKTGATADIPAPDAGEIEWAGAVVKKPPAPEG